MTEIDKIKKREEIGYTMSVYSTRENLYMQMREDIMTLINHIEGQTLPIDSVVQRSEPLNCTFELGVENCGFKSKDVFTCKHIRKCDMCAN